MVGVPIDNSNSRATFDERCCRHRNVVQETETHRSGRFRVMTRRANGCESEVGSTTLDRFDRGQSGTRGVLSRGPRSCRDVRVRVQGASTATRCTRSR